MKKWFGILVIVLITGCKQENSLYLTDLAKIIFADSALAAKIVVMEDEYTKQLGPYEMSASMKTTNKVTYDQFMNHLAVNVRSWLPQEKEMFERLSLKAKAALKDYDLNFPEEIILIKTTADEYGGISAAYTRMNAIMFTEKSILNDEDQLLKIYYHELFHVFSRQNPNLQKTLYQILGFEESNEIELPSEWNNVRITNPDAPVFNTVIELDSGEGSKTYTPYLFSTSPVYDTTRPGGLFQSVAFQLIEVIREDSLWIPLFFDGEPVFQNPFDMESFWQKIGKNTQYIIHPEEILASNFELLMLGETNVPNPEILHKLKEVLAK
jgi:hypothetical protein